jgi:hypothetical protein
MRLFEPDLIIKSTAGLPLSWAAIAADYKVIDPAERLRQRLSLD